jgi:hypothetical protein
MVTVFSQSSLRELVIIPRKRSYSDSTFIYQALHKEQSKLEDF